MDIYEIRKANLVELIGNRRKKECADKWELNPAHLSQILSLKTEKNLGDDVARRIEDREGLPRGWLDALRHSAAEAAEGFTHNVVAYDPEDAMPDGAVAISEYQVNFSAGNGHQALYEIIEESDPAIYKLSWFRAERIKPEKCKRFRVKGDSMETTLFDGDSVLVNMEENEPTKIIDGKVYALRYGNDLRIKRLFKKLDGSLRLVSDNQAYPIEDIAADVAQEHITIIGRVRDKSGKGGL
ncbi:S24 family peptidase [Pseudomonas composti]|uniref:S24 family peptidase n=1 Tax=Ectopseudomonas composti TaxID=658457 RepID=UPI0007734E86|nr:S24 family peptidase [Pseudomonas composti]